MANGNYTYPAVITPVEDGLVEICFPDLDQITCAEAGNPQEIIETAQSLLALTLSDALDCGQELPAPTVPVPKDGETVMLVNVWLPYHRAQEKITYVKKTLTIPAWLDILGKEKNVNYSALLVRALKEELKLS